MFADRTEAGGRLADRLASEGVEADLVLAIPRGGLPVGRAVADRLGAPLDVVVAVKLGAPGNPELAVGAVAGDGSVWTNDDLVSRLGVRDDYLQEERARGQAAASEKVRQYRGGDPLPRLDGRHVVIVDDGLATGATALACVRQVQAAGAEQVTLAVPVAAPESAARVRDAGARVVAVETPEMFGAVGQYYRDFRQVRDAEALTYLDGAGATGSDASDEDGGGNDPEGEHGDDGDGET
ncbi:phosphoribosyltransferase [Salinigranum salinum]|uniref:phosphoribosyltransferase n=1 Tax=Salinigranum salinum TaxID=1364937 RepID=UPI001260E93F|nr:phosphoribosyltransferase family protein [Salinigranum salinum]